MTTAAQIVKHCKCGNESKTHGMRCEIINAPRNSPPYCKFYVYNLCTGKLVGLMPDIHSARGNFPTAVISLDKTALCSK